MDVFLINGSSLSMSSRPPATIGKPSVFQKPHKPKPPTKMSKMPVKKAAVKAGNNIDRQNHPRTIRAPKNEETNLLVKLPSVESDDYKTPSSSSSSNESSEDSDNEEGEVDSEPEDREGQTSRAILSENEDGRFSGANSPWFESQDHDETTLSELVQNAQEIDIEEEDVKVDIEEIKGKLKSPPPEEPESLEPEKNDGDNDVEVDEEEPRQQPLSMKNGRLHRSKTPETMVQLIDDIESSESNDEKEEEVKEAELNEELETEEELPPKIRSPQAEAEMETEDKQSSEEPSVLEKAKAGNEKRMARFLQDGEFYDTYPIKKGGSEDQRSMSASTVTLPSPVSAFTPELANEEYTGGYNDILNVLERLEDETAKEGQEDSSEDKDSGRPQSESSSATASPKRTSTSSSVASPMR